MKFILFFYENREKTAAAASLEAADPMKRYKMSSCVGVLKRT